jgi:hypothetical protein
MNYRVAKIDDYPAITGLINGCGYYAPMAATDLDGPIIIAEHDGELKGCLWAMVCGRHAFIDYLVAPTGSGRVALMLMLAMEKLLREAGVIHVRGHIASHNKPAVRIAHALGGITQPGYDLAYKRLQNGNAEDGNEPESVNQD